MSITLRVYGDPAPQGSKRHVGGGRMIESSKRVKPWREAVRARATETGLTHRIVGPCAVEIMFYAKAPIRQSDRWPISRRVGDIDKLARAVLDGLTVDINGQGLLRDDSLVVTLTATKVYAAKPNEMGATITITPLEDDTITWEP